MLMLMLDDRASCWKPEFGVCKRTAILPLTAEGGPLTTDPIEKSTGRVRESVQGAVAHARGHRTWNCVHEGSLLDGSLLKACARVYLNHNKTVASHFIWGFTGLQFFIALSSRLQGHNIPRVARHGKDGRKERRGGEAELHQRGRFLSSYMGRKLSQTLPATTLCRRISSSHGFHPPCLGKRTNSRM